MPALIWRMNDRFINKIFLGQRVLVMDNVADEPTILVVSVDNEKIVLRNLELFEEFSQHDIAETVKLRRKEYAEASAVMREKLASIVDEEIESFSVWLSKTRNFEPMIAHYYAVSLRSLLTGLTFGRNLAELFEVALTGKIEPVKDV